jgi:hypothetical protein
LDEIQQKIQKRRDESKERRENRTKENRNQRREEARSENRNERREETRSENRNERREKMDNRAPKSPELNQNSPENRQPSQVREMGRGERR